MRLNTAEKFLLLIQNPKKPGYLVSETIRDAGITGAILSDLVCQKKIEIINGSLKILADQADTSNAHSILLQMMQQSGRNRKIKTWISKLSRRSSKYRKELIKQVEKKGFLRIIHKQFLWIKYDRTELIKSSERQEIIQGLREVIFHNKEADKTNAIIAGLIHACKLHKIICENKEERRICKHKLEELMRSDPLSQGVNKAIKEMQAAITGAVAAATVGASAGAASSG